MFGQLVRWCENHGGIGLQRGVRVMSSKGGLGKTGQRVNALFIIKGGLGLLGGLGKRTGPRK